MKTRYVVSLVFTAIFALNCQSQQMESKPKLIYFYDPLCGWCYAFSPVMVQLYEQYSDRIDMEILSGGMVIGERVSPLSEIAPYIRDGVERIETITDVRFGDDFKQDLWGKGERIMNSWPASVALRVFKSYLPDKAILYAAALQKLIYHQGISSEDSNAFAQLAQDQFGIPMKEFLEKTQDQEFLKATRAEFEITRAYSVSGYPHVILEKGNKRHVITRGYAAFAQVSQQIEKVLKG